jgi:hypothetical protein
MTMTQHAYHSGPLAEVKTIVTTYSGRTVVFTYKPPLTSAAVSDSPGPAAELVRVPASVEIKFANGTVRSFSAETGEWITEVKQGKQENGPTSPARKRHPDRQS